MGVFLDRYGARRVQTVLLGIAAAGCFLFAAAPDFLSLVASRAIIGLGFSAGLMASFKASSIWVPIERRSLANASIRSAGAVGIVMATEPTAFLVTQVGWRTTFAIFGGIILAGAAFVFLAVPEKDEAKTTAGFGQQVGELIQILKLPLFWRIAPLLALTAGSTVALQTLWAGPWLRDVMGLAPHDVARSLFWMAASFMVGIFLIGVVADRLQKRGVSPMTVLLGFVIANLVAQSIIVLQVKALSFPAWCVISAVGQVAILAYPWFAQRVGPGLAGRSNASINFAMFLVAFAAQAFVGVVIGWFPQSAAGYDPNSYIWAFGLLLALEFLALFWYLFVPIASLKDEIP